MTRPLLPIIILLVLVLAVGWLRWQQRQVQPNLTPDTPHSFASLKDRQRTQIVLNQRVLEVEVVTQPASISLGLGGRQTIGADGMLFILPHRQQTQFWMKDMLFDLDLIWIRNQEVVGVDQNVPAVSLTTSDKDLPLYSSPGEVDMVLEVVAGQAAQWQIVPGTNLELK